MKKQVVIIGAGPAGSCAAALLHKKGIEVLVIEKENFPRFVIGESLLPFCMSVIEECGFLDALKAHGFQYKNGAAFSWGEKYRYFDFCDKSSSGFGTTFQVQRADFDKLLIDEAQKQGVEVLWGVSVENASISLNGAVLELCNKEKIECEFIIDASGYGRVLPRLFDLEKPSTLAARKAYFTHIEDRISEPLYDRKKILITTHPQMREVWFWLIPFSNGRCSIGVVGEAKFVDSTEFNDGAEILKKLVYDCPMLKRLLNNAQWDTPVRQISGYSKDVKTLFGDRFLLLGNATEFLDPVFSSGVTIAMYSSKLAAECVAAYLKGQKVDFQKQYADELMIGVNAFRTYVNGWYSGVFQDVIYTNNENQDIKRQICSILAGYAWDKNNPYAMRSDAALAAVAKFV